MVRSVIKQYGMERTGTNWIKAMMEDSFEALVLSNGLGHKHDPPVSYLRWLTAAKSRYLDEIAAAVDSRKLKLVISVKDPYGAAYSFKRYARNRPLETYLIRSNINLQKWLGLCFDSVVVRYEDLLKDANETLRGVAQRLDIRMNDGYVHDITDRIESGDRRTNVPHSRNFWKSRQYIHELSGEQIDLVTNTIDWNLYGLLGYERLP